MSRIDKHALTKLEIIRVATRLFLEKGYTETTIKMICQELDMSPGNVTFYFHTKEHMLVVLVKMLCSFQGRMMEDIVECGKTTLLAVCMEVAVMAAMSENSAIAKDLFISSYTSPMCLEIIRRNDNERSKIVYGEFCENWDEERYQVAEELVSGIEYATLMTVGDVPSLENRIAGALNNIMKIYNVPEEIRRNKIRKVLKMDYVAFGERVLKEFKEYVERSNVQSLGNVLHSTDPKTEKEEETK